MPDAERRDSIIVGGGLAGLTCGVALADRGLKPLVLDRAEILGGRARSWIDPDTGDPVHIGPHIFLSIYPNMFALLDRLGTRGKIRWIPHPEFITMVDGTREIAMRAAPLPPPMHFVPSVLADPTTSLWDKASNVPLSAYVLRMTPEEILALDDVSAHDFLVAMGVTRRYRETFWAFTALAIMNVPLQECSAAALLRFYQVLVGRKGYQIGMPACGLGDLFAPQSVGVIRSRGGEVWKNTSVERILFDESQHAYGVRLADGRELHSDHVIAALPPHTLARLLPQAMRDTSPFDRLDRFEPCPYVSVYLWFDRKLTRRLFWARTFDSRDLNCDFYDYSNILPGYEHRGSLITSNIIYSARVSGLSDDEIVAKTLDEIAEYLPEARRARLKHSVVNRIPMAIHCPRPGTERLRPDANTPTGLILAGDWTNTGLPSSMESAVASGWRAAEVVLGRTGREVDLVRGHWELPSFPVRAGRVLATMLRPFHRTHLRASALQRSRRDRA